MSDATFREKYEWFLASDRYQGGKWAFTPPDEIERLYDEAHVAGLERERDANEARYRHLAWIVTGIRADELPSDGQVSFIATHVKELASRAEAGVAKLEAAFLELQRWLAKYVERRDDVMQNRDDDDPNCMYQVGQRSAALMALGKVNAALAPKGAEKCVCENGVVGEGLAATSSVMKAGDPCPYCREPEKCRTCGGSGWASSSAQQNGVVPIIGVRMDACPDCRKEDDRG